ncbi:unnamed protein product [Parajaminaea phylloscopi]
MSQARPTSKAVEHTASLSSGPSAASPSTASKASAASWASSLVSLPATQEGRIALTAVASCAATAASIFAYQAAIRAARRRELAKKVDKATHIDRQAEKRLQYHEHLGVPGARDDEESIDGGTPRYLDHLAHLAPSKSNVNLAATNRAASPLRRQASRTSVPDLGGQAKAYDETLIREQLSRNFSFVGDDAMQKLRDAFVVVVGLGGVGSHVALSLIRSGVGHVRLIDFDQVSLSSLNRHAVANLEDVGRPKVVVCQEHFRGIAPWVQIQAWVEIFNESEAPRLFSPFRIPGTLAQSSKDIPPTYVIDCIDNLNTKVGLLAYCHEHGIKVFSSMGAGAKCDPTRICIGDLTFTEEDPLAKSVRRRLRERGIPAAPPQEKGPPGKPPKSQRLPKPKSNKVETPPRKNSFTSAGGPSSAQATPRPASATNNRPHLKGAMALPASPTNATAHNRRSSQSHHLSRASSVSSFGSGEGAFYTPEGTPREENVSFDEGTVEQPPELRLDGQPQGSSSPSLRSPVNTETGRSSQPISGSLQRPQLGVQRSSSELEELSTSPLVEKNEAEAGGEGYSIESTPGFSPSTNGPRGGDADANGAAEIWKRETTRRTSQGSESQPHRVDGRNPGADPSALWPGNRADDKIKTRVDVLRRSPAPSSAGTSEDGDDASAVALADAHSESKTEHAAPWTSQNPRYLIPCIFSTEKPSAQLLPLDEAELAKDGGAEMLRALEDGNEWRVRTLPVLGPLPAIFGLSIAAFVICDISGRENLMEPLQNKLRRRSAEKTLRELEALENNYPSPAASSLSSSSSSSTTGTASANRNHTRGRGVPFLLDDVLYIVTEVFRCRSVVPPFPSVANATLVRWDSTLPLSYQNVALLTREQARKHTQEVLKKGKSPVEVWGDEAMDHWRKRMEEERWYARFRQ